jgi:hypothetical protein
MSTPAAKEGYAFTYIAPEIVMSILKGLEEPLGLTRQFQVAANPLPADARLVDIQYDAERRVFKFLIGSATFEPGKIAELPVTELKTVETKATG